MLGLGWDKREDVLNIAFPSTEPPFTKRGILSHLAQIYDPLGLATPRTLEGKLIYREACLAKAAWDAELHPFLQTRWRNWAQTLPSQGDSVPRSIVLFQEPILDMQLHAFGDASSQGVGAAVYAVVHQPSGTSTRLLTARGRLAKQGLTIPRLELVGAHMACNLLHNVETALTGVAPCRITAWVDSTVVLYWLKGTGQHKQFVANRVHKIQQHTEVEWRHVPTKENPADLASRGGQPTSLWWNGPEWLADPDKWPPNPVLEPSEESNAEAKLLREVLCVTKDQPEHDSHDHVLSRFPLHKTLRIGVWARRFLFNCRYPQSKRRGLITTEELQNEELWWIRRTQSRVPPTEIENSKDLGLSRNAVGLLECRGRIEGKYPIYLPDSAPFTAKLVARAHMQTLHGGVTSTMAHVRVHYWVPRLRRLVKHVRNTCNGCKRHRVQPFSPASTGTLPTTRTEGNVPYQVIGIDFAGPIRYRQGKLQEGKAYLALFACSLTRGVHLELVRSLETTEFVRALKRFIARRGRPAVIYSDNGSTFKAAADWLRKVRNEEKFNDALARLDIKWKFNLAKAPWWGGQFERLIGVFKGTFYKVIGKAQLIFEELAELVLDIEVCMNNRPLCYLEDDVTFPTLTPNVFLFQSPNAVPELPAHLHESQLRKRAKFLLKVKNALWTRWVREYLNALRERHRISLKADQKYPKVGDLLLIKGESPNRSKWLIGRVTRLIIGRDGETRGANLQTSHGEIERPLRFLYPLELSCDSDKPATQLNPTVADFQPRRDAATAADLRIQDIATMDQNEL